MPVYNAGPYLDAAVESILGQTFADFRFFAYDDCSTDGSYERLLEWQRRDDRIDVLRGERRLGPVGSSNAAARAAGTPFVARMDADDIAAPDRLEVQLASLLAHERAVLVGSTFHMIDGRGRITRRAVPARIGGRSPPAHPTILYRREAFEACGGYRDGTEYFEDRDLIGRMAAIGDVLIVNRALLSLRFAGQHARLKDDARKVEASINRLFAKRGPETQQLHPMTFYRLAILKIHAAQRPAMMGKVLRKMNFGEWRDALAVLALIGAGNV
jgi:glycosyltransferase involved in cell wall biosynthesis